VKDVKEIITSARSISRLTATEMIHAICEGFVEFHGDRKFGDDPAIVGGIALLDDMPVTVIGTQKGHDVTEMSTGISDPRIRRATAKRSV